jgi:hypothetical protein
MKAGMRLRMSSQKTTSTARMKFSLRNMMNLCQKFADGMLIRIDRQSDQGPVVGHPNFAAVDGTRIPQKWIDQDIRYRRKDMGDDQYRNTGLVKSDLTSSRATASNK